MNKRYPKIRFSEFEKAFEENGGEQNSENPYAWEQRKLRDIAEFNPKSILPDLFKYIDLESVVGTNLLNHRIENKENAPSRAQRLAQRGDVFYQTVRPYQKNNYLFDLPDNDYVFSTGYAQMRPKIDSYFLLSQIQEERFVKSVLDKSTGTSYPAINSNDLADIEIKVPTNCDEQKKIGSCFRLLDTTITLHQRKLKTLEKMKKSYLQKLFPKNGEQNPEIRFTEFKKLFEENGGEQNSENPYAWEQRKVGDLFKVTRGYVLAAPETTEKKTPEYPYPVYSSQTKNDGLMGYYKDYLYADAITWTTDGANAGTVRLRPGKFYCTNVCGVLLSDEGYANKAVTEALNNIAWRHVSHVGNPKLMNNVMNEIVISVPRSLGE